MKFLGGKRETTALGRPSTFLNVVLDESGSMDVVTQQTIDAFNTFIQQQRDASAVAKDDVFVTLTKFSDSERVTTVYTGKPLAEVPKLTTGGYQPDGNTALYDGIFKTVRAMEKRVGIQARVLTLVITDGEENDSVELTDIEQLRELIASREARGNWTFVFLSAGWSPYAAGANMGFKPGNTSSYTASHVGPALASASQAVAQYRKGEGLCTDTFFAGAPPTHDKPNWTQTGTDDVEDVV